MPTSLVSLITKYPDALRKALAEQARLENLIEKLEETVDPEVDEEEEEPTEVYKPNFEENRNVVRLEAKIEKNKIKLKEAEGKASQMYRNENPKATIAAMTAAEDTDPNVIKIRMELADFTEQRKLLEIEAREGDWIQRNGSSHANASPARTDREQTKLEKQLEKARLDLEKANAEVTALRAQFKGYKLLAEMGVTEI